MPLEVRPLSPALGVEIPDFEPALSELFGPVPRRNPAMQRARSALVSNVRPEGILRDNVILQRAPTPFDPGSPRTLRRVPITDSEGASRLASSRDRSAPLPPGLRTGPDAQVAAR